MAQENSLCVAWEWWAFLVAACAPSGAGNAVAELLRLSSCCCYRFAGAWEWASAPAPALNSGGTLLCVSLLPCLQLCKVLVSKALQAGMGEPLRGQLALSALCRLEAGPPASSVPLQPEGVSLHPPHPSAGSSLPRVHCAGW